MPVQPSDHPFRVPCEKGGWFELGIRAASEASEELKQETTLESHPSKNEGWGTRRHGLGPSQFNQSKMSTADAITVVQSPRLSPTADCVTLAVRTILFEIR